MNYLLAIAAGAIQGITEFLPISSTGHLIIFEKIFKISQADFGLAFDASLHLGTLFAVLIFFWRDYLTVFNFKNKLFLKLVVTTAPAAVLGLLAEREIESQFRQLWILGITFILFSFVMIMAEKLSHLKRKKESLNIKDSLLIGIAQSFALIPGVSRSGATISAGLFLHLEREEAARFAFMISGPIIAGAGAKKFLEVFLEKNLSSQTTNFFLIGILSSAVFGYLTIKYFLKYLSKSNLYPMIAYRFALGLILILLTLL